MRLALVVTGVMGGFLLVGEPALGDLTDGRVSEVQSALTPPADEPWRTIPWQTGLLEAQREAARSQKPIFIWAMDGHPLGCT